MKDEPATSRTTAAPTAAQIDAAATAWCGEKERETFHDDILYFRHNWRALPLQNLHELQVTEKPTKFRFVML